MIKLGTSGFSFDDWKGPIYPPKLKKQDMLSYYEKELGFKCLEINSTYYTLPSPKSMEGMAKKTSEDFEFTVKAFKGMTHEIWDNPPDKSVGARCNVPLLDNRDVFEKFNFSMKPLTEAGRLRCILAQFPPWFHPSKENLDYLRAFKDRTADMPVVVEFRNQAWHKDSTLAFLKGEGLGYCVVDEPRLPGLMPFNPGATSTIGYFRLHGRNPRWFNVPASVRYDYLYSEGELQEFLLPIEEVDGCTETTFVFFNNCHGGSAVKNAMRLRDMLQLKF
ncbi:MAG TPA: DUF72 domain-containing protein [Candidatus Brocadiales bacterium]|nr:DUF72 domain-containing protein [Candidatus Brocadiales bacterium]